MKKLPRVIKYEKKKSIDSMLRIIFTMFHVCSQYYLTANKGIFLRLSMVFTKILDLLFFTNLTLPIHFAAVCIIQLPCLFVQPKATQEIIMIERCKPFLNKMRVKWCLFQLI